MSGYITQKQERVYIFISDFIKSQGYPPSVREIGEGVGLRSTATVKHHLDKLVSAGYLHVAEGKTRAITLVDRVNHENSVPLLGHVAAGAPILAEEHIEEYIPFDTQGKSDEYFALRVRGESMINAAILPDDCVIVHRQEECLNKDIVVAIFEDEATVKTYRRKDGIPWLCPENDDYQPIDGTHARIIGKVVGVIRRFPEGRL